MKNSNIFFILIVALFFNSCQKDFVSEKSNDIQNTANDIQNTENKSMVGKKLNNPYSVVNMNNALSYIKNSINLKISTSHYYVKFIINNQDELDLISSNQNLDLYDYPLDYEIDEDYLYNRNKELEVDENSQITLYCSVKKDFKFPNINYVIIEELFIPEQLDDYSIHENFYNELIDKSLRLTDNYENINKNTRWRPAGKIRLWDDDFYSFIELEGVEVRARRWFITYKGITNIDGDYVCDGTFRRKANYSIKWKRYDFTIRDSWLGTAKKIGPKKKGNWDWDIPDYETFYILGNTYITRAQNFYATIFKATYHYYYKDIDGLRRPPLNSFWHTKLKLRAYNESNDDVLGNHNAARRFFGLGSAIKIYNPQRNSKDIYGTVIHELAHASHWNMDSDNYNCMNDENCMFICCSGDVVVAESWARGVQWVLTRMVYPYYNIDSDYSRRRYTGVVEDMIDGFGITKSYYYYLNEDNSWVHLTKSQSDKVMGYTIRQIEDALIGIKQWDEWKINIQNSYNNGSEYNLQSTFDYWND